MFSQSLDMVGRFTFYFIVFTTNLASEAKIHHIIIVTD